MKRRNLLKGGALLAGAPLAAIPERLYGEPRSVAPREDFLQSKFVLPLERSGIPESLMSGVTRFTEMWNGLLKSHDNARLFLKSPSAYLARFGLDTSDAVFEDENVRLLSALIQPDVKDALAQKDYARLFQELTTLGVFSKHEQSKFQAIIEERLLEQEDELKAFIAKTYPDADTALQTSLAEKLSLEGALATSDDLASLDMLLKDSLENPLRISTAVNATFVVIAFVAVVALVVIPVEVIGDTDTSAECDSCEPDGISRSSKAVTPFVGRYTKVDTTLMRNAERSRRLASLTGDKGVLAYATRELIRAEVSGVLGALSSTSIIPIAAGKLPLVIEALTKYSWKCVGLAE